MRKLFLCRLWASQESALSIKVFDLLVEYFKFCSMIVPNQMHPNPRNLKQTTVVCFRGELTATVGRQEAIMNNSEQTSHKSPNLVPAATLNAFFNQFSNLLHLSDLFLLYLSINFSPLFASWAPATIFERSYTICEFWPYHVVSVLGISARALGSIFGPINAINISMTIF